VARVFADGWPTQSAYCASKFAVRGYTESLRHELRETGVDAVTVHPGGIATNIVVHSRFHEDDRGRTDKAELERDFAEVDELEIHSLPGTEMSPGPRDRLAVEEQLKRFGDKLDQRLFGRDVVVHRRDVDANALGDIAGPQAFDALFGDQLSGSLGYSGAPVVTRRPAAFRGNILDHGAALYTSPRHQSII